MKKIFYYLSIFCIALSVGCLDEIDLETEPGEPVFVVSGNINDGPPPYTVELTESGVFSSGIEGIPDRVNDGIVTLFDTEGNSEVFTLTEQGVYQTAVDGMRGTIGKSYYITVQRGGKTFFSRPEKLLPVLSPESADIELVTEEEINEAGNFVEIDRLRLLVSTPLPVGEEPSFLKWNVFGIYEYPEIGSSSNLNPDVCYVTEKIDFDNVAIINTEDVNGDFLEQQRILTRNINYKFTKQYCFNIIQQSLTAEAYDFWERVGAEFQRTGDIFETPPSKIRGNIYNPDDLNEQIAGFFYASARDTLQFAVFPDEVGTPRPQCVPFPQGPEPCYNCLLLPNSTLDKPLCWD